MNLTDAIFGRRAVRAYRDEAVAEAVLRRLIDAAIQAPSAINAQPWAFTVVTDRALLDRMSRDAKDYTVKSIHAGATRPPEHAAYILDILAQPGFDIFYRAPALIVISAVAAGDWAVEDCALAAQNLMLAAHGEGLGSCWIGFAQRWLNTDGGKAAIHLPPTSLAVAPIVVGHPAGPAPAVPRQPPRLQWIGPH